MLREIREANRRHDKGEITWEQRVLLHNIAAPGIGNLEHQAVKRKER